MFVAQLFGLADASTSLLTVRCTHYKLFGLGWLLIGPVGFLFLVFFKIRHLVAKENSMVYTRSPYRTLADMRAGWRVAPGLSAKFSQLFIYFMDLRFSGGWALKSDVAKFWGFTMAAFTDSFWMIIGWILLKKIWTNLTKHLLETHFNAAANVAIYSIDFLLFFRYRPFRDNLVNFSQGLAALSNFLAILLAALPHLIPKEMMPGWVSGELTMWVTTAGTAVLTVFALLDPTFAVMGQAVQLGSHVGKVCGMCKIGGGSAGDLMATTLTSLRVRFEKILLARFCASC